MKAARWLLMMFTFVAAICEFATALWCAANQATLQGIMFLAIASVLWVHYTRMRG